MFLKIKFPVLLLLVVFSLFGCLDNGSSPEKNPEPPIAEALFFSLNQDEPLAITLKGSSPENKPLTFEINSDRGPRNGTLTGTLPDLTYTPNPGFTGSDQFSYRAHDGALTSDWAVVSLTIRAIILPAPDVPADPAENAPPLSRLEHTPMIDALSFLYTGENPLQKGVAQGTIEAERVALFKGRVLQRDGSPLSGVTVRILDRPEYGSTLSRLDGRFDLVVNGGGLLTLQFEREGYLPVQRRKKAVWQQYVVVDEVVLIPLDPIVTTVRMGNGIGIQVASGSVQSDGTADSERKASILFPEGTTATMTLPDGTTEALTEASVRATEYTVGDNGPAAMPGELPAFSGYTYAVELSVDEAIEKGATRVDFNQDLPLYVDNFRGYPLGEIVPTGWYDRQKSIWVPSQNGRVIGILSIENGRAALDVDGSGNPATPDALQALGIDAAEQAKLAELYPVGKSLWRAPINHFTPWDCNWPYGPPEGATPPPEPPLESPAPEEEDKCKGCIISPQSQSLGEEIPIEGSDQKLHYLSSRMVGANFKRTINIPLTSDTVPAKLKRIEVTIDIAGKRHAHQRGIRFTETGKIPIEPNQSYAFFWDGRDSFNRPLLSAMAGVTITYVYPAVRYAGSSEFEASFGQPGEGDGAGGFNILPDKSAFEIKYHRSYQVVMDGGIDPESELGGFTLSDHHRLDPLVKTLWRGDGGQVRFNGRGGTPIRRTRGESGAFCGPTTGGPLENMNLGALSDIEPLEFGAYLLSFKTCIPGIFRVNRLGNTTHVYGSNAADPFQEGMQAIDVPKTESHVYAMARHPNGELYLAVAEILSNNRSVMIRRVDNEGKVWNVAQLSDLVQLEYFGVKMAFSPEGVLHIASQTTEDGLCVKRLESDNRFVRVVGNSQVGYENDIIEGALASNFRLFALPDITFDDKGNLVFFAYDNKIGYRISPGYLLKVLPSGQITVIAGKHITWPRSEPYGKEGTEGKTWRLDGIHALTSDDQGGFYFIESRGAHAHVRQHQRIAHIDAAGIIRTIIDRSSPRVPVEEGDSIFLSEHLFYRMDLLSSGELIILGSPRSGGTYDNLQWVRVKSELEKEEITIPSSTGDEVYLFSKTGRHLETRDTLLGTVKHRFEYTPEGRLSRMIDHSGNILEIEYSGTLPSAIIAPKGQRTSLSVSGEGLMRSVTTPSGTSHGFSFTADGLLSAYTDLRGITHHYGFSPDGRLISDVVGTQSIWELNREESPNTIGVRMVDGDGINRTFTVTREDGVKVLTHIKPDETQSVTRMDGKLSSSYTDADGTQIRKTFGADPRFGYYAMKPDNTRIQLPSGRVKTIETEQQVEMDTDLLAPIRKEDRVAINGNPWESVFDRTRMTLTRTSPVGRRQVLSLNDQGKVNGVNSYDYYGARLIYNSDGTLGEIRRGPENAPNETRVYRFTYDPFNGKMAAMTDPMGKVTGFTHTLSGKVEQLTVNDDTSATYQIVRYDYDASGNLTGVTPYGKGAHGMEYNFMDLINRYAPPPIAGVSMVTTADHYVSGQLKSVTRADNRVLNYHYVSGKLDRLTFPEGEYRFAYNPSTGKLREISVPGASANSADRLGLTFDGNELTGEFWSGRVQGTYTRTLTNDFLTASDRVNGDQVSYAYDEDLLLTNAGALTILRNPDNPLVQGTELGSISDTYTFDGFAELSHYAATAGTTGLIDQAYTRDRMGRITSINETLSGGESQITYTYHDNGALSAVRRDGNLLAEYGYDGNGNRTHINGVTVAVFDAQDRMVSDGSYTYTYSAHGELIRRTHAVENTVRSFDFDSLGNLKGVTLEDGTDVTYLVDGRSRRVGKMVGGTLEQGFLYADQLRPIAELNGQGQVVSRFVYGEKQNVPAYMIKGGISFRIISDHLGSPRLIVNSTTGEIVQAITYDTWGNVLTDTNPGFQPFGFAGGLYDGATQLVQFGFRTYDPHSGRFISKDQLGFDAGHNVYLYAENDPVNFTDPGGQFALNALGAVLGATCAGVSQAIKGEFNLADIAVAAATGAINPIGGFFGGLAYNVGKDLIKCEPSQYGRFSDVLYTTDKALLGQGASMYGKSLESKMKSPFFKGSGGLGGCLTGIAFTILEQDPNYR